MRVTKGFKDSTLELTVEDFTSGINTDVSEVKSEMPSCALWMENLEVTRSGDLVTRPDGCRISLRDPLTLTQITQETNWLIPFAKVGSPFMQLVATSTRLFLFDRYQPINLQEVTLEGGAPAFRNAVTQLDWETFEGKLYIASGSNPLLCWDGINDASYIEYEANYNYPSIVRRHMGRLVLSGFTDINDTRAQSNLRFTELADATTLTEHIVELRTSDDDVPRGMASLQSGLVTDMPHGRNVAALIVGKGRNTIAVFGSDFANFTDIEVHPHTPGVGWAGPQAWTHGTKGLYFASDSGIYLVSGPGPAQCVSRAIAQVWGREYPMGDKTVPKLAAERMARTALFHDPTRDRLTVMLPVNA